MEVEAAALNVPTVITQFPDPAVIVELTFVCVDEAILYSVPTFAGPAPAEDVATIVYPLPAVMVGTCDPPIAIITSFDCVVEKGPAENEAVDTAVAFVEVASRKLDAAMPFHCVTEMKRPPVAEPNVQVITSEAFVLLLNA